MLLTAWKESNRSKKPPQWQTAKQKVMDLESIVPLLIHTADLSVRPWFQISKNVSNSALFRASVFDIILSALIHTQSQRIQERDISYAVLSIHLQYLNIYRQQNWIAVKMLGWCQLRRTTVSSSTEYPWTREVLCIFNQGNSFSCTSRIWSNSINLPRMTTVRSASYGSTCIIQARNDRGDRLKGDGHVSIPCNKSSKDPEANANLHT